MIPGGISPSPGAPRRLLGGKQSMGKDHFYGDVESYIIHLLEVHTRVSVSDLCATFGLAPSTIRKKLADMRAGACSSGPMAAR